MADWKAGGVVQGKGILRLNRVEFPVFQHGLCPSAGFLGGLEQQHDAPTFGPLPGHQPRQPHQDRHMPIVAAKVPDTFDEGAMGWCACLVNRQGVEFTAEKNGRAILAPVENRRHTFPAQIGDQVIGRQRREFLHDALGGLGFIAGNLGVAVQIVPQGDEIENIGIG